MRNLTASSADRIWVLEDHSKSELVGFSLSWLPNEAYRYLTPIKTGESISLEAGPYVGSIMLGNGDTLQIEPRCGRKSFNRMMMLVDGLDDRLIAETEETRIFEEQGLSSQDWLKLVATKFADQLIEIERKSLISSRNWEASQSSCLAGKVDVRRTLPAFKAKLSNPIFSRTKRRNYDIKENKFLAFAADILIRDGYLTGARREAAYRWVKRFDRRALTAADFAELLKKIERQEIDSSRKYYIKALLTARVITGQSGISFTGEQKLDSQAFFTNMPMLFEKYMFRVIEKTLDPMRYHVKKPKKGEFTLFQTGAVSIEPDVLIYDNYRPLIAFDVKYKPTSQLPSSDYYQMITYLSRLGLQTGGFLVPTHSENSIISHTLFDNKQIFEIRINLSDWIIAENYTKEALKLIAFA